jgi:uncharacterized membrane protein YfcA
MTRKRDSLSLRADRLGIIASAACFVHCILTPVVISFAAVWAHYIPSEEKFHRTLAVLVAAVGGFAILTGYSRHRRKRVLLFMAGGLFCIFAGAWWGDRLPSHLAEVAVTLIGSCLMITAHLINHTFCKHCDCADEC